MSAHKKSDPRGSLCFVSGVAETFEQFFIGAVGVLPIIIKSHPPHGACSADSFKDARGTSPTGLIPVTDELIAEHQRVWSRGGEISEAEAIEIILNIVRFAEAILEAVRQEGQQ